MLRVGVNGAGRWCVVKLGQVRGVKEVRSGFGAEGRAGWWGVEEG